MPTIEHATILFERFDWCSETGNVSVSFNVTQMLMGIRRGKLPFELVTTPMDETFAREWIVTRDLNLAYVHSLKPPRLDAPVLGAWAPDNSVILIDGSHRYMARYLRKLPTIDYLFIAFNDWQPYAKITGEF